MKNDEIRKELERIGFRRCYKGFNYLSEIIETIHENKMYYDFNLRNLYVEVSKNHSVKPSVVKGDIHYLINGTTLSNYNKKKLIEYTGFTEVTDATTKKVLEIIVDKLFL